MENLPWYHAVSYIRALQLETLRGKITKKMGFCKPAGKAEESL